MANNYVPDRTLEFHACGWEWEIVVGWVLLVAGLSVCMKGSCVSLARCCGGNRAARKPGDCTALCLAAP